MSRDATIQLLWRQRPKNHFLRASLWVMLVVVAVAWLWGGFGLELSERRWANLQRFASELRPYPLQDKPFDWGVAGEWTGEVMASRGWEAVLDTLAISVGAIVLAMFMGLLLCMPAARNFANPEPFLPAARRPTRLGKAFWTLQVQSSRAVQILLRAIPEYVWAFLLLAMLGLSAWPAILALALHNAGILGRLSAETIENTPNRTLAALRGLGAERRQIAAVALLPLSFGRLLVYFFYRWEICVREATALGMLGIASLGFAIDNGRVAQRNDEMLLFILAGTCLVILGDFVSMLVRHVVRRAWGVETQRGTHAPPWHEDHCAALHLQIKCRQRTPPTLHFAALENNKPRGLAC